MRRAETYTLKVSTQGRYSTNLLEVSGRNRGVTARMDLLPDAPWWPNIPTLHSVHNSFKSYDSSIV